MPRARDLSTTEVAEICQVSVPTVLRWIDEGKLEGYVLPGRGKRRRVPRNKLAKFMKEHNLPMDRFEPVTLRRLLIVDDDKSTITAVRELLDELGRFEVESASSGFEAGAMTEKFQPHVILLDLRLPDIDGFRVCQQLKRDPATAHIKIIAISGYIGDTELKRIKASGFDAYIRKPFGPVELMKALRQAGMG